MAMTRCRLENPVRADQPMILISQIQRSGGKLRSRRFDAHPACFAHPYELSGAAPKNGTANDWPQEGSAGTTFNQLDQEWARRLAKKGCYKKGPIQKNRKVPVRF
jgi:hypothetical protein